MTLQINTFDDLLEIVNTHPEWRRKLVKALFPEIDLPKALQELVESNRLMRAQLGNIDARLGRMEEWQGHADTRFVHIDTRFDGIDKRFDRMEDRQARMEGRQDVMDQRLDRMDRSLADLKGDSYEANFTRKADAIFGVFLRRGRDGRQEIVTQLEQAEESGQITDSEYTQVLAADLLWTGRPKQPAITLTLVVEISWFAEEHDLNRAGSRAEILRKLDVQALAVVAAREWSDIMRAEALHRNIVIVDEYKVDRESWHSALAVLLV